VAVGLRSTSEQGGRQELRGDGLQKLLREPGDHFALFGLERRFDVDDSQLEKAFLELSRELHPDRHREQKARALALTAAMNQAYATLKDRTKRAEYLLRLLGGKTADQDKRTPAWLLAEMLELREAVEGIRERAPDPALARQSYAPILADLEDRANMAWVRIDELFRAGDTSQIRLELNSLKYIANLAEELRTLIRG
jgi:molecular chaperone HscB